MDSRTVSPASPLPDSAPAYLESLFGLAGKRVLVIGGSGILGGALVEAFLRAGARVALTSTKKEKAEGVAAALAASAGISPVAAGSKDGQDRSFPAGNPKDGPSLLPLALDAQSRPSLEAARAEIEAAFGGLDVLVNAAGGNSPKATVPPDGNLFALDPAAVEEVWRLNFMGGAFLPLQVFGEAFHRQKTPVSIIHISSMAALLPLTRVVGYASAKAAVDNFTRWCAVEFARKYGRHIRVNAIAPGFFLTEQNRFLLTDKESGALTARGKTIIEQTPMGEFGRPSELAGAALWLASEASAFVTGIILPVDGGFSAFSGV